MEQRIQAYQQAVQALPQRLRTAALALSPEEQAQAEELRLRAGWPMTAVLPRGERPLGEEVRPQDLEHLVEVASRASVHAVLDQIRRGYLTAEGGHRIGLCGTAVMREGEIHTLRAFSSASLRIARQVPGAAKPILEQLHMEEGLASTLILAPPGLGKTTLLRDLIRSVSEGEGCPPLRVAVADERGELTAPCHGRPQLDVGRRTDVLEGCPKAQGLMLLLRAMNPQALAVDEITAPEDVQALQTAAGCGVILLATAHGTRREDLERRCVYRPLLESGIFRRLVRIQWENGRRVYTVEEME